MFALQPQLRKSPRYHLLPPRSHPPCSTPSQISRIIPAESEGGSWPGLRPEHISAVPQRAQCCCLPEILLRQGPRPPPACAPSGHQSATRPVPPVSCSHPSFSCLCGYPVQPCAAWATSFKSLQTSCGQLGTGKRATVQCSLRMPREGMWVLGSTFSPPARHPNAAHSETSLRSLSSGAQSGPERQHLLIPPFCLTVQSAPLGFCMPPLPGTPACLMRSEQLAERQATLPHELFFLPWSLERPPSVMMSTGCPLGTQHPGPPRKTGYRPGYWKLGRRAIKGREA